MKYREIITYAISREYLRSLSGYDSMVTARCCPADCALREDWEDELNQVKTALEDEYVTRMGLMLKAISHPFRLKILLMLSNRDQCVCEFIWIFEESSTLISNHLKILRMLVLSRPITDQIIRSTGSEKMRTGRLLRSSINSRRRIRNRNNWSPYETKSPLYLYP